MFTKLPQNICTEETELQYMILIKTSSSSSVTSSAVLHFMDTYTLPSFEYGTNHMEFLLQNIYFCTNFFLFIYQLFSCLQFIFKLILCGEWYALYYSLYG